MVHRAHLAHLALPALPVPDQRVDSNRSRRSPDISASSGEDTSAHHDPPREYPTQKAPTLREEHDRERELVAARLAGSIAHMVGTPLQVIAGRAALARRTASLDEALSHIQIIERKCREVSSDLQRTVDLLRHLQGVATKCDVAELFTDIVHELRQEYPASELELELPDDPMRPATLHAGELRLATKGLVRALATSTNTSRLTLQIREIEQERSRRMLSITLTTEASLRIESSSSLSEPWRQKSRTLLRSADLALPLVYEVSRLHGGDLRIVDQSLVMTWALDSVP